MDIVIFGVVWIVITTLGEWVLIKRVEPHAMYFLLSNQGNIALHAFDFLMTMMLPVFLLVIWWLVWAAFRYHADNGEAKQSRLQFTKNGVFTAIWILGSILLNLLFWLHPTAADLEQMFSAQLPSAQKNDLIVDVTARQWEWIFSYPQYHLTQTVNARGQDELVIPAHKKIEFRLRSYDPFHTYDVEAGVIHSFWVPAFGIKEDVIPGETRYEYIVANRTATYQTNPEVRVQCAEVCGPGHPWMEAPMKIVTASQFKSWIAKQQKLQGA